MREWRLLAGSLAGTAMGGLLCLLVVVVRSIAMRNGWERWDPVLVYPTLIAVPFFMGLTAAWVWKPLKLRMGQTALHSFSCMLIGIATAGIVLHEGVVCLIIISPLLYAFIATGALLGRIWFQSDRTKLNVTVLPLLFLLAVGEPMTRVDETAVVTDEILIHASPEKIWPHVTAFPDIPAAPHFWLFRLGLPMPMSTTAEGNFVGADRRCIFSSNAIFAEKVAEIEPSRKLTFDIVQQPADPELLGHLTAHRGQFLLRDNRDGTTTLIGSTWYSLHVRPLWYFDWWTRYICRAVHLRVMENIKAKAEHAA